MFHYSIVTFLIHIKYHIVRVPNSNENKNKR
jgi:hypothetical protein